MFIVTIIYCGIRTSDLGPWTSVVPEGFEETLDPGLSLKTKKFVFRLEDSTQRCSTVKLLHALSSQPMN